MSSALQDILRDATATGKASSASRRLARLASGQQAVALDVGVDDDLATAAAERAIAREVQGKKLKEFERTSRDIMSAKHVSFPLREQVMAEGTMYASPTVHDFAGTTLRRPDDDAARAAAAANISLVDEFGRPRKASATDLRSPLEAAYDVALNVAALAHKHVKRDDVARAARLAQKEMAKNGDPLDGMRINMGSDNEDNDDGAGLLSPAELQKKRAEMRHLRNVMSSLESRKKWQTKIKSKSYRRHQRRREEREKENRAAALAAADPAAAAARERAQLTKHRALERLTQRHKNTAAAVRLKRRAAVSEEARDGMHAAERLSAALRARFDTKGGLVSRGQAAAMGGSDSDSDESDGPAAVEDVLLKESAKDSGKAAAVSALNRAAGLWSLAGNSGRRDDDGSDSEDSETQKLRKKVETLSALPFLKAHSRRVAAEASAGDDAAAHEEERRMRAAVAEGEREAAAAVAALKPKAKKAAAAAAAAAVVVDVPVAAAAPVAVAPAAGAGARKRARVVTPEEAATAAPAAPAAAGSAPASKRAQRAAAAAVVPAELEAAAPTAAAAAAAAARKAIVEDASASQGTKTKGSGDVTAEEAVGRAFADDSQDIAAAFAAEKAAAVGAEVAPFDPMASLPGWGEWGGEAEHLNASHKRRVATLERTRAEKLSARAAQRADWNAGNVIVHDSAVRVSDKLLARSKQEAIPSQALSRYTLPQTVAASLHKPAVSVPHGAVVKPLSHSYAAPGDVVKRSTTTTAAQLAAVDATVESAAKAARRMAASASLNASLEAPTRKRPSGGATDSAKSMRTKTGGVGRGGGSGSKNLTTMTKGLRGKSNKKSSARR